MPPKDDVALSTYPRDDAQFEQLARSAMASGAATPAALEIKLRERYPQARVVDGIRENSVSRWYAYRDGRLIVAVE
jgi:hypothetical protein